MAAIGYAEMVSKVPSFLPHRSDSLYHYSSQFSDVRFASYYIVPSIGISNYVDVQVYSSRGLFRDRVQVVNWRWSIYIKNHSLLSVYLPEGLGI